MRKSTVKEWIAFIAFLILVVIIAACQIPQISAPVPDAPVASPSDDLSNGPRTEIVERFVLSWESDTRLDRIPSSDRLMLHIEGGFEVYDKAEDTHRFCPNYKILSEKYRKLALGEFMVNLSYYESTTKGIPWNPAAASVDVGKANDRNTWSVGLFQVSVNDYTIVGKAYKFSYDQLLTPLPNIDLAMALMHRIVRDRKKFIIPNSDKTYRYWAVILDGNKYNKLPQIVDRMKKSAPFCFP